MTCAGILYSPMIGAYYPGRATAAYEAAYRLSIFDLGYARDISALIGAMVAAAMAPNSQEMPVDTLFWGQMQHAYARLETLNQDLPFHAAEIHLVNLTALLLSDFDFEKALVFVINYGRDNDTTGIENKKRLS